MAWPPTLDQLKAHLEIADTRDDAALQLELDAAVEYVEERRPGFAYDAALPGSGCPEPPAYLVLGTVMLAGRWYTRRRSPDGLVEMAELGTGRVPSIDPDIGRMLGLDRFAGSVFA